MSLFKKKTFFTEAENEQIVQAIREAEQMTSGEVRIYVEGRCRFVDAMDRAKELFLKSQMQNTKQRNGVLLYVALKDRQFAILGDEGIHQKVGDGFWKNEAATLRKSFIEKKYAEGIARVAKEIGASLKKYFPYQSDDEDELPNDIIFGK